jgi:hypothetical protein
MIFEANLPNMILALEGPSIALADGGPQHHLSRTW